MSIWFSPTQALSYNANLMYIIGARGCGKTYGCKKWAIKRFLKYHEQFIYLRRYEEEMKDLPDFFRALEKDKDFEKINFQVVGSKFYINNELCGYAMILSKGQHRKSGEFTEVSNIIFDEFIIEKGYIHYLPDEVQRLLGLIDTVVRNRNNIRVFCLANSIQWTNPHFVFWKFAPMEEGIQVKQDGTVLLQAYKNSEFNSMRETTVMGRLAKGTAYGNMALDNVFEDLTDDFIMKKPKNARLQFNIFWKKNTYGIWMDEENSKLIVSERHNKDSFTVCYTTSDFKPNLMLLNDRHSRINDMLKRAFKNSYLYYENVYIRDEMYDLMNMLGIRS